MNTIEAMRKFFDLCSVINIGLYILAAIKLILFHGPISSIHAKMFDLDKSDLSRAYIHWLSQYKIAIFVFSIVPYFALKIMG